MKDFKLTIEYENNKRDTTSRFVQYNTNSTKDIGFRAQVLTGDGFVTYNSKTMELNPSDWGLSFIYDNIYGAFAQPRVYSTDISSQIEPITIADSSNDQHEYSTGSQLMTEYQRREQQRQADLRRRSSRQDRPVQAGESPRRRYSHPWERE